MGGVREHGEEVTDVQRRALTPLVSDEEVPFLAAGVFLCWPEVPRWYSHQWNNKWKPL